MAKPREVAMPSQSSPRKKTSYRAMTSLVTTWSFIISTVTGVVLYITPQGRIANWVVWDLWSLTKSAWGELHIIFSIVFVLVGVAHLVYNWKPFKNYMSERAKGHVHIKRTLYGSLAIIAVFFVLSIKNLPPANWIFDLEDTIKESWIISPEYEPPFGHAEDVSLSGFAKRQFIDLGAAVKALNEAGIQVPEKRMKLKDIAAINGVTPMDLYLKIKPLEKRPEIKAQYSPEDVEAQFAGTGIGRKTLTDIAKELGMEVTSAQALLSKAGIDAKPEDKMKGIAEKQGIEALDLLKVLLVNGFSL
jgi:hypothetical protein